MREIDPAQKTELNAAWKVEGGRGTEGVIVNVVSWWKGERGEKVRSWIMS